MLNVSKQSLINRAVIGSAIEPYLTKTDKLNDTFLIDRLAIFPEQIKAALLKSAYEYKTTVERNTYIRKTTEDLLTLLPKPLRHLFFSGDDEIQLVAKQCADDCRKIIIDPKNEAFLSAHHAKPVNEKGVPSSYQQTRQFSVNGISSKANSVNEINRQSPQEQIFVYEHVCRYVTSFNLTPPKPNKRQKISGCLKRLSGNRWWLRKIRKLVNQANEKTAITLNLVNRRKQIYASNITTRNRLAQIARNEELLSSHFIINDAGQRYSLKEISDVNVSNPAVKKAELINRVKGFENLSKEHEHSGLFITITCPSKYHRAFSKSGAKNPKWDGSMPDDAQRYLNKQWSKIRAELKRKKINIYGLRVVEPQHDGTPHWHCLFYTKPENIKAFEKIVRFYALQVDGDEKGALENRCDIKPVDPNKNATGYIMKYIVKNIDGEGLGQDKFGNDALTIATRINAWAACFCIRQFQVIGGASVSVWRELRRLKERLSPNSVIEKARVAADDSDWMGYVKAMGGIDALPKTHPIKLHYGLNVNTKTGECLESYYDGELITKVKGLLYEGIAYITRKLEWRLERLA
ncbi:MAG: replication endonuclease [Thalassotalea sp.]